MLLNEFNIRMDPRWPCFRIELQFLEDAFYFRDWTYITPRLVNEALIWMQPSMTIYFYWIILQEFIFYTICY